MFYLVHALSVWLIAGSVLGLLVGLVPGQAAPPPSWKGWSGLFLSLYIVAAAAAVLRWAPGRYGFWLETALLLLTAYVVGGALGGLLSRLLGGSRVSPEIAAPTAPARVAPDAARSGLVESIQAWTAQAEAFVAVAPAALSALSAAQKALADGEPPGGAATKAPAPILARPERSMDEDNLRLIRGIDEKIARGLHELGVWRFAQIAAWTPEEESRIAEKFVHCGPALRKYWIAQARLLASGVDTEYAQAARSGEARGSLSLGAPLDEAAARSLQAVLPQVIAPQAKDELYAGVRPLSLLQPPLGEKDDLAKIAGIDPPTLARLNTLGIWTFGQIARWSDQNVRWIGFYLAVPGRIERENWVEQARALESVAIR